MSRRAAPVAVADRRLRITRADLDAFAYTRRHNETYYEPFLRDHPRIVIAYEDLLTEREREFARTLDFLDVGHQPLETRTRRQNPEPLRDLIANFDELCAEVAGTRYEPMLND
jgi:hypothetical protein